MAQIERKDINKRFDYLKDEVDVTKIVELKEAASKGATKAELVELIKKL